MPGEKVFGKCLRALKLRGNGARTEAGQAKLIESVDNACDQRRFGADDGQTDVFVLSKLRKGLNIIGGYRNISAARLTSGARITWCDQDLIDIARLRALPRQGVFASTGTDDLNFH